jgi:hypothetical protein
VWLIVISPPTQNGLERGISSGDFSHEDIKLFGHIAGFQFSTITRKDRVKLSIPAYHRAHNHQHALLRPDPLHMRLCCRPPVRAGTFTELEKIE